VPSGIQCEYGVVIDPLKDRPQHVIFYGSHHWLAHLELEQTGSE